MQKQEGAFHCCHCNKRIHYTDDMGTKHRNHCPFCLWSKHVDLLKSGDRVSGCKSCMKPIGLTFKNEGVDKYGNIRQGELMVIHECTGCKRISINRIASDDYTDAIINIFNISQKMNKAEKERLQSKGITLIPLENKSSVLIQLFGKNYKEL